jgi:hypothetical protein
MSTERIFASRYRNGVFFLSGPALIIAPLLVIPGVAMLKSLFLAAMAAIGSLVLSSILWTWARRRAPALILSREGLSIDGLPTIPWRAIANVRRTGQTGGIEVRLVEPPSRERGPFADQRPTVTPVWRMNPPNTIVLRAELLEDAIAEIESAFRYFLGGERK